jgi:hypothetical protein
MILLDVDILREGDQLWGLSSSVCRSVDILKIGDRECMVRFEQSIVSKEPKCWVLNTTLPGPFCTLFIQRHFGGCREE